MATKEKRFIPLRCWHCDLIIADKRDYFCIHDPSGTENLYVHKTGVCKNAATKHVVES